MNTKISGNALLSQGPTVAEQLTAMKRRIAEANADSNSSKRIIIGVAEQYGMPISSTVIDDMPDQFPKTTIRWRQTADSFVLEQWKLENPKGPTRGIWVEVPCVL